MSAISKCDGDNCPLRENCYRYTSTKDQFMQSYIKEFYDKKTGECEYQIKTNKQK